MSNFDELDYMSDAFVCTSDAADIRPGLNPNVRKSKQKFGLKNDKVPTKCQTHKPSSVKHLEKEKRDDGLQTPISAENKGFAMLAKMGFKPGTGLGKTGEGRTDPVPINVKSDKSGLGREAVLQEMAILKAKLSKESKRREVSVDDYRKRIVEKAYLKFCKIDLSKSQKICYTLDSREGITVPEEKWFWHDFNKEEKGCTDQEETDEEEEEEEDDDLTDQDRLELLTLYLRRTYYYCIWCATQFDDEKDLQQDCPGPSRDDH